jgi:hypothetical protein
VYVGGTTSGTLPGTLSAGSTDIFIRKYDPTGTVQGTRQFGTATIDQGASLGLSADALYVGGATDGSLAPNVGGFDGFLAKLAL